jgi:hypothetical protein
MDMIFSEYSAEYTQKINRYKTLFEGNLPSENFDELKKLYAGINELSVSGPFENYYSKIPFLFWAFSYIHLRDQIEIFPSESKITNSIAARAYKMEGITKYEFNLLVRDLREDVVFEMIDKYSNLENTVMVNYGANHDFTNNVEKYNLSKSDLKDRFCLIDFYPTGILKYL